MDVSLLAELYNIEFDPEERYNLIDRPRYAGVVKRMQRELLRAMAAVRGQSPRHAGDPSGG